MLHGYVMSNKQQQIVVPTEVQSVSPPAASAVMMLRGIHSLLAPILMLKFNNFPPTTDSILHHSRRGEDVSFVKILGILLEHVH